MIRKMFLLAALAFLPCLATATTVTYTTSGSFSGGTLPISFIGAADSVSANPSGTLGDMGTFVVGACAATCSGPTTFTLTITQSSPTPGSAPITATITGKVVHTSAKSLRIDFGSGASVTIGGVTYVPLWPSGSQGLKFGQNTTVQLVIAAPEPTSALLLGLGALGLMGLAFVSRDKILTC